MKRPLFTKGRIETGIFIFLAVFQEYEEAEKDIKWKEQMIGQILDLHPH